MFARNLLNLVVREFIFFTFKFSYWLLAGLFNCFYWVLLIAIFILIISIRIYLTIFSIDNFVLCIITLVLLTVIYVVMFAASSKYAVCFYESSANLSGSLKPTRKSWMSSYLDLYFSTSSSILLIDIYIFLWMRIHVLNVRSIYHIHTYKHNHHVIFLSFQTYSKYFNSPSLPFVIKVSLCLIVSLLHISFMLML